MDDADQDASRVRQGPCQQDTEVLTVPAAPELRRQDYLLDDVRGHSQGVFVRGRCDIAGPGSVDRDVEERAVPQALLQVLVALQTGLCTMLRVLCVHRLIGASGPV